MRHRSTWNTGYKIARIVQVAVLAISAIAGGLLKLDADEVKKRVSAEAAIYVVAVQGSIWWIIPIATGLIAGCEGVRKLIGPPWAWESVQRILDNFHREAFNEAPAPNLQQLPVCQLTLYRRVKILWRGFSWWRKRHAHDCHPDDCRRNRYSGWLVPVARAWKYKDQSTRTVFLCPDDAKNSEGVPGLVWWRRKVWPVKDLPVLDPALTDDQLAAELTEYSQKAGVSVEWLKARRKENKHFPRSMCGIPIDRGEEAWGVLMLDSTDPNGIKVDDPGWPPYRLISLGLSEVLKRT